MISTEIQDKRAALFAKTDTETLLCSLVMLYDTIEQPTPDERLTGAWIADEIERRHPEISPLIEAVFEADLHGSERPSYSQIVVDAYWSTRPAGAE